MNKQEIFEKVAKHLLVQNEQSSDPIYDKCMYRDPDGRKCAVGCLIPDDKYFPMMDFMFQPLYNNSSVKHALGDAGIDVENLEIMNLLQALQSTHDSYQPEEWVKRLKSVALMHKLDTPDFL